MAHQIGSLLFTSAVQALQAKYGSRRQYAGWKNQDGLPDRLGPMEREFLAERNSFYMASISETGWPYVQHRGGPKGFLKVLDDATIAFADFRGNRQYISAGNLNADHRVALILVDYPTQTRLKILGRAEIVEKSEAKDLLEQVYHPEYKAQVERVFLIHVEAFDWNCQQHITPRYTADEIREALKPVQETITKLEETNKLLRTEIARLQSKNSEAFHDQS